MEMSLVSAKKSRFPLSLPHSLRETVRRLAEKDGVSDNQWIAIAVAQKVALALAEEGYMEERRTRGKPSRLVERASKMSGMAAEEKADNGSDNGLRVAEF